jgi:hypothetical protein
MVVSLTKKKGMSCGIADLRTVYEISLVSLWLTLALRLRARNRGGIPSVASAAASGPGSGWQREQGAP